MKPNRQMHAVFDLDGTLADTKHRERFLTQKKADWTAFYEALEGDTVIPDVLELYHLAHRAGFKVGILTGRPVRYAERTREWLTQQGVLLPAWTHFRGDADQAPSVEFKVRALQGRMKLGDIWMLVDNDLFVCKAFAALGVSTLHFQQPLRTP